MAKRSPIPTPPNPNPLHDLSDEEVEAMLTPEEREQEEALIQGLRDGSIRSTLTEERRRQFQAGAAMTLDALGPGGYDPAKAPSARITMRLSHADLALLRQKAQQQGLPYQTLLRSVIHQYLNGQLVPRP